MISNSRALQILLAIDMFALLAYNMAGTSTTPPLNTAPVAISGPCRAVCRAVTCPLPWRPLSPPFCPGASCALVHPVPSRSTLSFPPPLPWPALPCALPCPAGKLAQQGCHKPCTPCPIPAAYPASHRYDGHGQPGRRVPHGAGDHAHTVCVAGQPGPVLPTPWRRPARRVMDKVLVDAGAVGRLLPACAVQCSCCVHMSRFAGMPQVPPHCTCDKARVQCERAWDVPAAHRDV